MRRAGHILLLFFLASGPWFLSGAAVAAEEGGAAPQSNTFRIREFIVDGNSKLPPEEIGTLLQQFTGSGKTSDEVEKARDTLEKQYHDRGYPTVLVNIPEQTVNEGKIRLEVIESRIDEVKLTGNRHFSSEQILAKLPSLAPGEVMYVPRVQKEVGKLNLNPDLKVMPGLTPSKTLGYVDVDLKAEERFPLHGSVELSNRSSNNTTALRANGLIRYDNLWHRWHSGSFQFQTAPEEPSEVLVFSGSYSLPSPWNPDASFIFYGVHSDSDTAFGEGFQTQGKGDILGMRYVYPLPERENFTHNVTLGVDYKSFDERTGFPPDDEDDKPRVTYLPLSVSYGAFRLSDSSSTQFTATVSMAIRQVVTNEQEFEENRYKSRGNYLVAIAGVEHRRELPKGFGIYFKIDGQIANEPLISNEQFAAGGMESVRGFKESDSMGDDALHGMVELLGPELDANLPGKDRPGWRVRLTPYLFYDAAQLWIQDPLPEQKKSLSLQGTGFGVRGKVGESFEFEGDAAVATVSDSSYTEAGDFRLHFFAKYVF